MRARPIALSGVLTALAVTLLCLGGVIPGAVFCAPILAMAVLLPVLEELGPKAAGTAYAAAAILALLLVSERETALVYVFFGWYPILRPRVAALSSRSLRVLIRLAVCNGSIFLLYGLLWKFLGLPEDLPEDAWFLNVLMLAMGNVIFLLTDLVLARLTRLWHWKLKKRLYR